MPAEIINLYDMLKYLSNVSFTATFGSSYETILVSNILFENNIVHVRFFLDPLLGWFYLKYSVNVI